MLSSGDYAPTILGDGGVSIPSQYFGFERDTGVYREITTSTTGSTSSAYAVSKRGTKRLRVTDTGGDLYGDWNISGGTSSEISLPDGTASAPSLSFTSEPDLGIYKIGSGILGVATGGGNSGLVVTTTYTAAPRFQATGGTIVNPSFQFNSDTSTGISLPSNHNLLISTNSGTGQYLFSNSGANFGTGSLTCGSISSGSIVSTGSISSGTNPLVCGAIIAQGTVSCYPNALTCGPLQVYGGIQNNETITTLNGTAGLVNCSMPFQGPNYKVLMLSFVNFVNNTVVPVTYTFPTPFLFTTHNNVSTNVAGGLGTTLGTTSIIINPNNTTVFNGYFSVVGT